MKALESKDEPNWREWSQYVLLTLETLNASVKDLEKELIKIRIRLGTVAAFAAFFGFVLGLVIPCLLGWFSG